jgi:hypothetical protein
VPSKADRRLERKTLKLKRELEKRARQGASPATARTIPNDRSISFEKIITEPALAPAPALMIWSREKEDADGDWSWGAPRACGDAWDALVHPFLIECGRKRWAEIDAERTGGEGRRRAKHIHYSFDQLIDEAYARLVERQLDDFAPNIFRFRLSGQRRLYGFRTDPTFFMLWFDPEHRLYKYR